MAKTTITGEQIKNDTVTREDLNITITGKAVIRKALQHANGVIVLTTLDGVDPGTGDVTFEHVLGEGTYHLPVGGTTSQILYWSSPGNAEWGDAPTPFPGFGTTHTTAAYGDHTHNYENSLTFTTSVLRTGNTITLLNDSASPGNNCYYGTDNTGTKGFFAIPAGGGPGESITYTHYAISSTGGSTIRLAPSSGANSDVKLASGTNVTVDYTSPSIITINALNTTYSVFGRTYDGLVPQPGGDSSTRFLREDGTWQIFTPSIDNDTWIPNSAGIAGYVAIPVPNKVWKTDGSGNPAWRDNVDTDTNTTYTIKASSQTGGAGVDLDAGGSGSGTDTVIFKGSGATTVTYTNTNTITISSTDTDTNTWVENTKTTDGYVPAPGAIANKVWKTDASGNPGWRDDADTDTNTTYSVFTRSINGLVPAPGGVTSTRFLREDGNWVIPVAGTGADGNTTYVFTPGTSNGTFKATSSNGDTQIVAITGLGESAYHADTYFALANHTHNYDNYGSWTLQGESANASSITSGTVVNIKGTGATTVTKTANSGIITIDSTNTWVANALSVAGYVAAGSVGTANLIWKCDGNGSPGWRSEATSSYSTFTRDLNGLVPAPGGVLITRFLREDGTWAVPVTGSGADGNTTYTFATGTVNGTFKVTPSDSTTQTITIFGLGESAYHSDNYFALAGHTHNYDNYGGWNLQAEGTSNSLIGSGTTVNIVGSDATSVSKSGNTITISSTDTNTTYSVFNRTYNGLVPQPGGLLSTRFLREDGTWVVPTDTNTTYNVNDGILTLSTGGGALTGSATFTANQAENSAFTVTHSTENGYIHLPSGGSTGRILQWLSNGTGAWKVAGNSTQYLNGLGEWTTPPDNDTNTTYSVFTRSINGLVPAPGGALTTRFLREDGTWVIPTDTDTNTWIANSLGVAGYVAAPVAGNANQVWKCDGSGNPGWRADADTDTNTWIANALNVAGYVAAPSAGTANLVWKCDASGNPGWRADLDTDTNTWVANAVGVAGYVAIPMANKVWKTDGSAVPAWRDDVDTNTTYSVFSRSVDGLVPAPNGSGLTRFLREDSIWAIPGGADGNTTYTFATGTVNGTFKVTPSDGTTQTVTIFGLGSLAYSSAIYDNYGYWTLKGESANGSDITTGTVVDIKGTGGTTVTKTVSSGIITIASPTVNAGSLILRRSADAGLTSTTIVTEAPTLFTANSSGITYYEYKIGPALTALALYMTDPTFRLGFITKSGEDSYKSVNFEGGSGIDITYPNTNTVRFSSSITDTWKANALGVEGYVAAGTAGTANQVWKCDSNGNPGWRADGGVGTDTNWYPTSLVVNTNAIDLSSTNGMPTVSMTLFANSGVGYNGTSSLAARQDHSHANIGTVGIYPLPGVYGVLHSSDFVFDGNSIYRITRDTSPTSGSIAGVTSGGLYSYLNTNYAYKVHSITSHSNVGSMILDGSSAGKAFIWDGGSWVLETPWTSINVGVTNIATSGAITGGPITSTGTISHSTAAGYIHIPTGGAANQILKWLSNGTAQWADPVTGGGGSMTSITAGTGLSGGTITVSGTIGLASAYGDSVNPYGIKTQKTFLAAPNASDGVPTFRTIAVSDVPTLNQATTNQAGYVANALTFATVGGHASGSTYNGSAARTISYSSIGAAALGGSQTQIFAASIFTISTGGWSIEQNGTALRFWHSGGGNATLTTGGIFTAQECYRGSSRTIKHDVNVLNIDAVSMINDIKIYSYLMNSDDSFAIGFIAEDTHPWLSGEEQKRHNFGNHLALLTKAIQEEDTKLSKLERRIIELEEQIKNLQDARG